jgi:hypothetical protein
MLPSKSKVILSDITKSPFKYRQQEGWSCFLAKTLQLFKDPGGINPEQLLQACRSYLNLNVDLNWITHIRPTLIVSNFEYKCIIGHFPEYIKSMVLHCSSNFSTNCMKIPIMNGSFKANSLNWCLTMEDEMKGMDHTEVYTSISMEYEVDVFKDKLEVVPIYKFVTGNILFITAVAFARYWGPPPDFLTIYVFTPPKILACIFQRFLFDKQGIRNFIFRIPMKIVSNSAGQLVSFENPYVIQQECPGIVFPAGSTDDLFSPNGFCSDEADKNRKFILWKAILFEPGANNRALQFVPNACSTYVRPENQLL